MLVFASIRGNDPDKIEGDTIMAIRLAAVAAAVGFVAFGALPAGAQSLDDLYAKAKGEGAFVLYVGGPTAPWEAMAKTFNARCPGINVSISGGFSNVLDKKIDAQIATGKLEVDTAILQTIADFVRWKDDGRLIDFKPAGFDRRSQVQGSPRRVLGDHGQCRPVYVQHRQGRSRRRT